MKSREEFKTKIYELVENFDLDGSMLIEQIVDQIMVEVDSLANADESCMRVILTDPLEDISTQAEHASKMLGDSDD